MTAETLTETRPFEPTTPIKPSEAIRLGCLLAPVQEFGGSFGSGDTACAVGAMALGWGDRAASDAVIPGSLAFEFWADVVHMREEYACPAGNYCPTGAYIPHLNDDHRWSRERIADWLEGLGL